MKTSSSQLCTPQALVAEFVGTAFLLAAIVGSGIIVEAGIAVPGVQLFIHAVVVGVTLSALIIMFAPISGAHFNPAVTVVAAVIDGDSWRRVVRYVVAQVSGGLAGLLITVASFGGNMLVWSTSVRSGLAVSSGELVATLGLLLVVFLGGFRTTTTTVAIAVGGFISAAIMFTSSAAFANPAVTIARMFTDTWSGVHPLSTHYFFVGQLVAVCCGVPLIRWLRATPVET